MINSTDNKNMAISVIDEELIEKTGGIVQGMSGAPIVQNDRLIGSITHVLLDNPKMGYASFIENLISDMNDLYGISDLLMTDYSSVFFDYSILKRPIIFYMYDLDDYKGKLRDFYIDLSELPGEIVKTDKELVLEVEKSKKFSYNKKYKAFNDKFTYLEDGEATRRVVEEIFD